MARITFGLLLLVSICSCQEAPGHPGSSDSVTPTPMPQFVRDMLTRLAEGKRDFHEAENRENQHKQSQSGESLMSVIHRSHLICTFALILNSGHNIWVREVSFRF